MADPPPGPSALPYLKAWRLRAGLSLRGLAARSHVGWVTIFRVESGQQAPTQDTIRRLARGLGIKIAELHGPPPAKEE